MTVSRADLPTLAEQQSVPRAIKKPHTRLDRAIANKAARLLDAQQLRAWAVAVKTRDHWTDRKTGRRVTRTLALDADRAEAHHLEGKDDHAVRYDVRNGICLSLATHDAVTTGKYRVDGTVYFKKHGVRYIDGRFPVIFVRT